MTTSVASYVDLSDPDDIVDAMLHRQALGFPGDDTPWEMYRALRESVPIFESSHNMWVLTRYGDALTALRHKTMDLGFNMRAAAEAGSVAAQLFAPTMLYFKDPEDTLRQRRLMRDAFTREAVQRRTPEIRGLVDELVAECGERGSFDFINEFADSIPVTVMCSLLGVPKADVPQFRDFTRTSAPATSAVVSEEVAKEVEVAFSGLRDYMTGLVEDRRKNLGEHDLLSTMIRASEGEEDLTSDELIGLSIFTLAAGSDTTTQVMTAALYTLLRFPDQLRMLREQPALMANALEECIRLSGPVHYTQPRRLNNPMKLGDIEIPAGETVLASVAGANRDPEEFPIPDVLDIARPEVRQLGFSQGLHLCIGATLARLEATIALEAVLKAFPVIEVDQGPIEYVDLGPMRGIRSLRLSVTPA